MDYCVKTMKNGFTVEKSHKNPYEEDIYVFLSLDDALAWIKNDSVVPAP